MTANRAAVFDLDGTLVDSIPDMLVALNLFAGERSFAPFTSQDVRDMVGGGARKLIERVLLRRSVEANDQEIDDLTARYVALYRQRPCVDTVLYANAEQVLRSLADDGVALAILTNKPTEIAEEVLACLGISDLFAIVVGGSSGFSRKPDPDGLRHVVDRIGAQPGHSVMIGDGGADVGAARAASIYSVVVRYGYSKVPVDELGADAIADDLQAVEGVLDRFFRQALA